MIIRNADENDIKEILILVLSYKPYSSKEIKEDTSLLTDLIHKTIHSDSEFLVCIKDNKTAGYINAHYCHFPLIKGIECYISDLIIHEDYRGQGIGSSLLTELEKRAKEKGCKRFNLNNLKNIESYKRDFYLKKGFTERNLIANFIKEL